MLTSIVPKGSKEIDVLSTSNLREMMKSISMRLENLQCGTCQRKLPSATATSSVMVGSDENANNNIADRLLLAKTSQQQEQHGVELEKVTIMKKLRTEAKSSTDSPSHITQTGYKCNDIFSPPLPITVGNRRKKVGNASKRAVPQSPLEEDLVGIESVTPVRPTRSSDITPSSSRAKPISKISSVPTSSSRISSRSASYNPSPLVASDPVAPKASASSPAEQVNKTQTSRNGISTRQAASIGTTSVQKAVTSTLTGTRARSFNGIPKHSSLNGKSKKTSSSAISQSDVSDADDALSVSDSVISCNSAQSDLTTKSLPQARIVSTVSGIASGQRASVAVVAVAASTSTTSTSTTSKKVLSQPSFPSRSSSNSISSTVAKNDIKRNQTNSNGPISLPNKTPNKSSSAAATSKDVKTTVTQSSQQQQHQQQQQIVAKASETTEQAISPKRPATNPFMQIISTR